MKRARRAVCTTFALLVILFVPPRWGAAETNECETLCSEQGGISSSAVPQAEYDALVAFYHATDGDNWRDNRDWLTDSGVDHWNGVWVEDGHVTVLGLGLNQLNGVIPPELESLTSLRMLFLYNNQLSGDIPLELVNLTRLETLSLSDNQLSGTVPLELGNMPLLEYLDLGNNQLSGAIPPELSNLSYLKRLALGGNQLSGAIPPELGNLANLRSLDLGGNELSGAIPSELGNMLHLEYLDLGNNQLSGAIPPELSNPPYLKRLTLGCNQLSGSIPSELGILVRLRELHLQGNRLSGEIPSSITNLTRLNKVPEGFTDPLFTDLGYNELWSEDPQVVAFLDEKDADWRLTQNVSPANVRIASIGATSVQLAWAPIPYSGNAGYYEVGIRATEADPYTILGRTESKLETVFWDGTLAPDTTYYLAVRSYTERHDDQQNDLLSVWSEEVQAATKHPYAWFAYVQEDRP